MQDTAIAQPQVRYARTPDGMNIAFIEAGEGVPVLILPFHSSHVERRWAAPGLGWTRGLAETNRVTTYDSRGQGLSTRNLETASSLQDYRRDMEAVMKAAAIEHSVLVAYGGFAHVAVAYAVEHPERVDALVLICTCESFSAWPLTSMMPIAEENWDLFADLMMARVEDSMRELAVAFFKACADPADYIHLICAFSDSSVSPLLDQLHLPVLVLHSLDQHWLSVEEGAKFAAKVEGARLVFLDGDQEPNQIEGVRVIRSFLADLGLGGTRPDSQRYEALRRGLTGRQSEILTMLGSGKTNREIADELVLSERTVERHVADVYGKLGARNRAEAVAFAVRQPPQSA